MEFNFKIDNIKAVHSGFAEVIQPQMRCIAEFKDGHKEDITNDPKYKEYMQYLENKLHVDFDKNPDNKLNNDQLSKLNYDNTTI